MPLTLIPNSHTPKQFILKEVNICEWALPSGTLCSKISSHTSCITLCFAAAWPETRHWLQPLIGTKKDPETDSQIHNFSPSPLAKGTTPSGPPQHLPHHSPPHRTPQLSFFSPVCFLLIILIVLNITLCCSCEHMSKLCHTLYFIHVFEFSFLFCLHLTMNSLWSQLLRQFNLTQSSKNYRSAVKAVVTHFRFL